MLLPGELKDRIDIYAENETGEGYTKESTYSYSFYDRAKAMFSNAGESLISGIEAENKTMKFTVRFHLTRYNERQLIKWRGDFYNIRGINPDVDRVFQTLIADRVPAGTYEIV